MIESNMLWGGSIMSKSLSVRKLRTKEARQLNNRLDDLNHSKLRRAEAILLYDAGLNAVAIAQALGVHLHTIYADLHAFAASGLECLQQLQKAGAPARITLKQRAEIIRLVEVPPYELGLASGRWSLSKLRDYLIKHRLVETLSREHLRRLLEKGGFTYVVLSPRSLAMIPNA
jgi:transposase